LEKISSQRLQQPKWLPNRSEVIFFESILPLNYLRPLIKLDISCSDDSIKAYSFPLTLETMHSFPILGVEFIRGEFLDLLQEERFSANLKRCFFESD